MPELTLDHSSGVHILKKIGNTVKKETLESMIIGTGSLRLKGKRKNAQKKLRHVFMNRFN